MRFAAAVLLMFAAGLAQDTAAAVEKVLIPAGTYVPFFGVQKKGETQVSHEPVTVKSFEIDREPVTNAAFLSFVKRHPNWSRSRVKRLFAEPDYLKHWASDFALASAEDRRRPVTNVSWFAAQAYCDSKGETLPTTDQWEYVEMNKGLDSKATKKRILDWYSHPSAEPLKPVGLSKPNAYGVRDLDGLIWEWTLDFESVMLSQEAREPGSRDQKLFCGGAAAGALDPSDYATFLRYSFRNSLKANYTVSNLGFRCAKDIQ